MLSRSPSRWQVDAHSQCTVNVSRLGRVETIVTPRPDIHVTGEFPIEDSATLRTQLHNWWQWVLRGGVSAIALDTSRRVDTRLQFQAVPGDTSIQVSNGVGVIAGNVYKLFHGPSYQLVRATAVSIPNPIANLTLSSSVDHRFGPIAGSCVFRDENYYFIQVRSSQPRCPIVDVTTDEFRTWPQTRFKLVLDFYETFSGTL